MTGHKMRLNEHVSCKTSSLGYRGKLRVCFANNISINYEHAPRFSTGDPEAQKYLGDNGFVIFGNVLTQEEAESSLALLQDLEQLGTGIDRGDITTWGDDRWPTAVHGSILQATA